MKLKKKPHRTKAKELFSEFINECENNPQIIEINLNMKREKECYS